MIVLTFSLLKFIRIPINFSNIAAILSTNWDHAQNTTQTVRHHVRSYTAPHIHLSHRHRFHGCFGELLNIFLILLCRNRLAFHTSDKYHEKANFSQVYHTNIAKISLYIANSSTNRHRTSTSPTAQPQNVSVTRTVWLQEWQECLIGSGDSTKARRDESRH